MNYYPNNNYYQNYSYQNQTMQPQPLVPSLQGKVVDSVEMVRVNEVPFGSFGVFPKGDLSEVYIKSWNSNGTTQINTYKPVQVEEENKNTNDELIQKINILNEKLDLLMSGGAGTKPETQVSAQKPVPAKDVKVDAY